MKYLLLNPYIYQYQPDFIYVDTIKDIYNSKINSSENIYFIKQIIKQNNINLLKIYKCLLDKHYALITHKIREKKNFMFRIFIELVLHHGYYDMIRWFNKKYNLKECFLTETIHHTIMSGNLKLLKWLKRNNLDNYRCTNVFYTALKYNHYNMVRWLYKKYGSNMNIIFLTLYDIQASTNKLKLNKLFNLIEWLIRNINNVDKPNFNVIDDIFYYLDFIIYNNTYVDIIKDFRIRLYNLFTKNIDKTTITLVQLKKFERRLLTFERDSFRFIHRHP